MQHEELTGQILKAAFAVSNELGAGFLESVYRNALRVACMESGLQVEAEKPLDVWFRGKLVGGFFADLVIADLVIIELKAARTIAPEHEAQLLNYLKATRKPVGLLLNFGTPKLEYRRYENRFEVK
jgi:GxxExxY protein